MGPLLDRHDLLLIDPRGTGRSDALSCKSTEDVGSLLTSEDAFTAAIGACGRELGARARLYGSAAVADDFEAVRAKLGLERLELWGESYGTYLMPVYAARHPQHVRSIMLSGAYPIEFDPWGRDRLSAALGAIRLVCSRTHRCDGDEVVRDLGALIAQVRQRPIAFTVRAGDRSYRARIDEGALASLVYAQGAGSVYGQLPASVAAARAGDIAPLRQLLERQLLLRAAVLSGQELSLAQFAATHCHDYPRAFSYAEKPEARRAAYVRARDSIDPRAFDPFSAAGWAQGGFESRDTCIEWPDDPTAASPSLAGLPDVPTLVLSGDLDANTPSSAGRQAAAQFKHATFLEIPNASHAPTETACGLKLALTFVATHKAVASCAAPSPPVSGRPARRAHGAAAVLSGTFTDLKEQAFPLAMFGSARALRGGRYSGAAKIELAGVRVVEDASVDGVLARTPTGYDGTLRLRGPGVPNGQVHVEVAGGRGRASGGLGGRPVQLRFKTPPA